MAKTRPTSTFSRKGKPKVGMSDFDTNGSVLNTLWLGEHISEYGRAPLAHGLIIYQYTKYIKI